MNSFDKHVSSVTERHALIEQLAHEQLADDLGLRWSKVLIVFCAGVSLFALSPIISLLLLLALVFFTKARKTPAQPPTRIPVDEPIEPSAVHKGDTIRGLFYMVEKASSR